MRNLYIGLGLAAALIAGLLAVSYFRAHPGDHASNADAMSSPAQMASQIKPDFVGSRSIGSWKLDCGKGMELPVRPSGQRRSENAPAGADPIPPHWKIPRCRIFLGLTNPKTPGEQIRITIRELGFKRALAVFLRFPPEEIDAAGAASLRVDQSEMSIPVRGCAKAFCLAIESIRRPAEPALVNAKTITLKYASNVTKRNVSMAIPTDGLSDAITAIRRIDR